VAPHVNNRYYITEDSTLLVTSMITSGLLWANLVCNCYLKLLISCCEQGTDYKNLFLALYVSPYFRPSLIFVNSL
jgi:hypothetical protein